MTIDITINKDTYNALKLDADLRAALADKIAGVSTHADRVTVHFLTAPTTEDRALAQSVIEAHDAAELTAEQQAALDAAAREAAAASTAAAIPGWATWDEDTTLTWLDTNVTDLASAKVALKAMARMLVALRDKNWPHLAA